MVLSEYDGILIKNKKKNDGYGAKRLLTKFLQKCKNCLRKFLNINENYATDQENNGTP